MLIKIKIVLLGAHAVGKTSLLFRYKYGTFEEEDVESTSRVYCIEKTLHVDLDKVIVNIWDTGGQEKYHSVQPLYYGDSDGAIIVYALNDSQSLDRAKKWVSELRRFTPNTLLTLVAAKYDLQSDRQVDLKKVEAYCRKLRIPHFVTSSKASKNVKECFLDLTKRCMDVEKQKLLNYNNRTTSSSVNTIVPGFAAADNINNVRNKKKHASVMIDFSGGGINNEEDEESGLLYRHHRGNGGGGRKCPWYIRIFMCCCSV